MKAKILLLIFLCKNIYSIPLYFCTAANSLYFPHLLNLIGSIHATNFDHLHEIAIFDLGLTEREILHLKNIQKVNLYHVEKIHPNLLEDFITSPEGKTVPGWYAWKPVIIKQSLDLFPHVLYIDAGATILKPLDILFEYILEKGYFLSTSGDAFNEAGYEHPIGWGCTELQKKLFNLDNPKKSWILKKETMCGGIIGITRSCKGIFFNQWYEFTKDLNNFKDDGTTPYGFGTGRHDLTLLSIIAYKNQAIIYQQDYTQKSFTYLSIKDKRYPFYVTWNPQFVCEKTHIYNSRGDLRNISYYLQQIKYK